MRQHFVSQRQSNLVTIRLRVPVGIIFPEQLEKLQQVACRYGNKRLHLTVRKTVEIPGVPLNKVKAAMEELEKVGWTITTVGDNIRNIVACPGFTCVNSRIDSASLGLEIDSNLNSEENLPAKLKIAVAGCPNACTHPQLNDIGVVGVAKVFIDEDECNRCYTCIKMCRENAIVKTESGSVNIDKTACVECGLCAEHCNPIKIDQIYYRILVGGKMGRHVKFARKLGDYTTISEVLNMVEKILQVYLEYGKPNERLGNMIDRISFGEFVKLISK
ncbi:MAG: 4Fe-4S binding protein [Thermoanaerobacteraceae bacterium]|nr:4Fe-4S binding protein [Thermoanaerobacteraceae bacterium]